MKPKFTHVLFCVIVFVISFRNSAFSQTGYFGEYFRHQCRDTNQFNNYTLINNSALNGDSNVKAIFTPYSAVGGIDESYHSGLFYNKTFSKWAIYNEKSTTDSVSLYSTFNILAPTTNGTIIKHTASSVNTTANLTFIDNPATNGKPNALLYISHNWGVTGGVYNNHSTGIFYHQASSKWGIFNEDLSAFPVGAAYNVFVVDSENANAFIHTTGTPSNITPYLSFLSSSLLGRNSVILVTHNFSPKGLSNNKYDTSAVGVFLKGLSWGISNMDNITRIDSGTTYNVLIANNLPNGVDELQEKKVFMNIYPNPCSSEINVSYILNESSSVELKLFSIIGQQLFASDNVLQLPGEYSLKKSIGDLPDGTYICSLIMNGIATRKTFVVAK